MNWRNIVLKLLCTLITIASFLSCSKDNTQFPTGIQLNKTTLSLIEGSKETLVVKIMPDDATDTSVAWLSSDESVAIVSELGEVTAIKVGTTTITATSVSNPAQKANCTITVTSTLVGIQFNKTTLSLIKNSKETLLVTIVPCDVVDKSVVWSSSDESVATVSVSGEVAAIKAGITTITATLVVDPSVKTTCAVTVVARPRDVYVVGNDELGVVTVWENSVATILSPKGLHMAFPIISNPICVSGNDLYVIWNENGIAKLCKNGVVTSLYDNVATDYMYVNSIRVSGSDVYILGNKRKRIGNVDVDMAVVWKNGVVTPLSEGFSGAVSISVSGNDVYVVGESKNSTGKYVATLWKNEEVILERSAAFLSVYTLGSDVYVAGNTKNSAGKIVATLWKNGVEIPLGDGIINTYANSVFAEGGDVYVVGDQAKNGIDVATVWKNGISTSLTDGMRRGSAYGVYVLDGDVYVAGAEYNSAGKSVAILWKNGVATSLSDGTINAKANSVYVVNR